MYLPISLSSSPQSSLQAASNYFYAGDINHGDPFGDIYAAVARWISHAFSVVLSWSKNAFTAGLSWARDAMPAIRAWLSDAVTTASQPVEEHPHATLLISGLIFLGPQIFLLPLLILQGVFLILLTILGFGVRGIVGGSPAAGYQSLCYGGNTPASSIFAALQSVGMKYHTVTLSSWVLAIIRLLAGLVFVYVVLGLTWLW
ncbi:hypothetical protein DFH09DRAFT_1143667 [Mycena vulgaris]|nr:hypothetical protein DFH09DRAFT_1143667 [Mycena vulgaris]